MTIHYIESEQTALMMCCNEVQFEYTCAYCFDPMGCYYCAFNLDEKHDCGQD